ncbi:MAG: hypothetical protein Kow0042_26050 [Calditrichia bacterium]
MDNRFPHPRVLNIVGKKKSGKTTLIEFLIRELTARGFRVGSLKHSSHPHPLDKAGSDSDRFRLAGANPVVFATPEGMAVFLSVDNREEQNRYLQVIFRECDLIFVESLHTLDAPKIALLSGEELSMEWENIIAVVNPQGTHPQYTAFRPGDGRLVDFIQDTFLTDK